MGKIANALGKYAQERLADRLPKLTREDRDALISYNRKTGHLLNDETGNGRVGNTSMEVLKSRGTIQRLLDHKLIFPGGKLTPKGVAAADQLETIIQVGEPTIDSNIKIKERKIEDIGTDDVIIELEEEVGSVDPSRVNEPTPQKVVSLHEQPPVAKPGSARQPGINETTATHPQPVEETAIERGKKGVTNGRDRDATDAPDMRDKLDETKIKKDRSAVPMPGISFNQKMLSKKLVSLLDPESYEAEQFKILRNSILFPVAGEALRTVLVTSSMQGEGKSFVSANLAISIAMNVNKHVMLVDCDLRKPDLHQAFGIGDVPGLSNYLAEKQSLESLLVKTPVEKLTLLPGGPILPNPSELASSEKMSALLEEAKHRYQDRLIVVDSPPPAMAAETSFLARQTDGILLVVKYGKTPKEDVEELMDKLGSDKIIGVVINYLDMPLSKQYGYRKYGRYRGYGRRKK